MRTSLHSRFALGLIVASAIASPAVATSSAAPLTGGVHVSIEIACKKAKIAGASKCIAAGQFCKKAAERDYNRYGFTCNKKDANGRWHLRYR